VWAPLASVDDDWTCYSQSIIDFPKRQQIRDRVGADTRRLTHADIAKAHEDAFAYSVGFRGLALVVFGGIQGHFTGINKAKSAVQTQLVGGLAAAYALAHAFS
jgi:hypothetical protein